MIILVFCNNYCLNWSVVQISVNLRFIAVFNFDCFKFALHWCVHHSSWVLLNWVGFSYVSCIIDCCNFCFLYLSSVDYVVYSNCGHALIYLHCLIIVQSFLIFSHVSWQLSSLILGFCFFNICLDFTFTNCSNYYQYWMFVLCVNLGGFETFDLNEYLLSRIILFQTSLSHVASYVFSNCHFSWFEDIFHK